MLLKAISLECARQFIFYLIRETIKVYDNQVLFRIYSIETLEFAVSLELEELPLQNQDTETSIL